MVEKIKEIPQKLNFFVLSFLGAAGLSVAIEVIREDDRVDKIDDALFTILAIAAVIWYRKSSAKKSIAPVVFMVLAVAIKIFAIIVEIADKDAVGDDFGIGVALLVALGISIYQYLKLRRLK